MKHPDKWRETADPFAIQFQNFQLERILGYPHAGNDVFHVEGIWKNRRCRGYLKVQRQAGANVAREAEWLTKVPLTNMPEVLEWSAEPVCWLLTKEAPGERLSTILGTNEDLESLDYLPRYGAELAALHGLDIKAPPVADRRFFHLPQDAQFAKWHLESAAAYLKNQHPEGESRTFVHGDFHYANLLWQNGQVSAILDWELAGLGSREFDMAWAVFRRPRQRFLNSWREVQAFLAGYAEKQTFSPKAFCWYYVLIAAWFFPIGDETDRAQWLTLMEQAIAHGA